MTGFDPSKLPSEPTKRLWALLSHLDGLRDQIIAELDEMEGDADFEEQCEDEGAACEDEGWDSDSEPDETGGTGTGGRPGDVLCNWQDEGDQTKLRHIPVTPSRRPLTACSPHENVRGYIRVRAL